MNVQNFRNIIFLNLKLAFLLWIKKKMRFFRKKIDKKELYNFLDDLF